MFRFLETIAFLVSSVVLLPEAANLHKEHELRGPYEAGNSYLQYWDFTGNSEVQRDFIRLTSDESGKRGAIWNNYVNQNRDWEFQMHFHIHGKGVNLVGDGMTIWYVRESLHLGPVFGSKDYFSGLAIFIDTYKNLDDDTDGRIFPYVSVMINNGSLHYDNAQDGKYASIGGCHAKVRNREHPTKIAVSYIKAILMVFLDVEGLGEWQQCFRSHGIHLPTGYYFGVSASTGELSDNHDVIAISTLDLDPLDAEIEDRSGIMPEAEHFKLPKEYKGEMEDEKLPEYKGEIEDEKLPGDDEAPSTLYSILKIVLYVAGIATILIVITLCKKYYEQRKVKIEKRLY